MSNPTCVRCGRPTPDGYACHQCASELAGAIKEASGHAEDAWTVIARQARYGGGFRASHDRPLPVDLAAAEQLAVAENTIGTWARHVAEEAGAQPPTSLAGAARWLATQVGWLRGRPEAGEAFDELHDACRVLVRLVDRPGGEGLRLVGMCDCGRILYARHGRNEVECKPCGLRWDVDESQAILRGALDERLVTAAEAAHLAAYLDTDRGSEQIRKLVNKWASRGELVAHGEVRIEPDPADPDGSEQVIRSYRFGDIAERLARAPRRAVRVAEMGA